MDRMAGGIVAVSAHFLLGEELLVETSSVCTECWQPEPCAPGISLPPGSPRLAWLVPPSPTPAFPAPWLPPHSPAPWDSTLGENHFLVQGRDSPRGWHGCWLPAWCIDAVDDCLYQSPYYVLLSSLLRQSGATDVEPRSITVKASCLGWINWSLLERSAIGPCSLAVLKLSCHRRLCCETNFVEKNPRGERHSSCHHLQACLHPDLPLHLCSGSASPSWIGL